MLFTAWNAAEIIKEPIIKQNSLDSPEEALLLTDIKLTWRENTSAVNLPQRTIRQRSENHVRKNHEKA